MDLEQIDDGAVYAVKLSRPVTYKGAKLLPLPVHDMTGAAMKFIIEQDGADDVIDSFVARE